MMNAKADLRRHPRLGDLGDIAVRMCQPPLTAAQAGRADQVIAALARLWPACFQVYEKRRRPLAIGIDKMLLAQMAPAIKIGRISETDIRYALRRYVGADGYLENCSINAPRIGLDGQPVGPAVTEREAARARGRIAYQHKQKLVRRAAQGKNGAGASMTSNNSGTLLLL